MNLFPLTVVQLMLVCFLLSISRATGEPSPPGQDVRLPAAANGEELLPGPVVEISPTEIRVEGSVVGNGAELADKLLMIKQNHLLLHPGEAGYDRVLVWADRDITWPRLREVLAAAATQDYRNIDFVVEK